MVPQNRLSLSTEFAYRLGSWPLMGSDYISEPKTNVGIRTLLVAGYTVEGSRRQPRHIEILCRRTDIFGSVVRYLIAITDQYSLLDQEIEDLRRTAETEGRILVVVAATASRNLISWEDFTEGLGGAVPTWHALTDEYEPALLAAAQNQIPKGMDGEAWLLFEDLVAHGLEFVFGRRVRRLGGRTRGRPVSDMQAQLPQGDIVVVDTKASASGFDVGLPNLRPLVEYVNRQRERQRGHLNLIGALVVSSKFRQGSNRLQEISREFLGEARLPVSFLTSDLLANSVKLFRTRPDARNGIRWNHILTGGLLEDRSIQAELSAVDSERIGIGG